MREFVVLSVELGLLALTSLVSFLGTGNVQLVEGAALEIAHTVRV